jgi:signal transduction histidine kinase
MTWDDWNEGTEMEPSLEKGFSSFFALMEFSARYRGFQADPEAVIRYAEDYLRAKNNGRIPAEAQAVLDQARAYLPTVRANIRKGLLEYQARQTPQPQPTAVPHRFRAVTGYLAAAAAGTVSLALTGLSAATLGLAPAGASLFLLWPLLGLVGGAYLAWGAVNYFRVGRAVEQDMGDALIERYYESRAGPGTKSFAALRNDPAAFAAWLESQPVEALSDILQQARTSAIAWSDGRVEPAAMAALEKANPRAAAQVRLHESFRREIPGLLALLPGLRDRFLAQAPQATAFRYSGQVSVQNMSRELNRLGVTWSTSGSRLELPAELSRLREYVFERDLAETSDELGVDPEQLWRTTVTQPLRYVLAELMRNAFDSQVLAGVERPIGLDVERRDGQWVIEISDNGLGIGGVRQDDLGVLRVTPKDRPQDQAAYQKISGGLGLGLPWTQLLVRLHGGSVEYLPEGREGYRTTVRLVFPEASLRTSAWFDRATPGERVQARATERPHPFRALSGYAATAVSGLVSVGLLGASLAFGYALPSWNTWLALLPVMGLFAGAYFAAGAVNYFRISRAVQAAMFETLLQRRYEGQAAPGGPTFAELRLSSREYRTWLDSLPGAVLASLRRQARNAVIAWSDGRLDAEAMAVLERTRPEIANRIRYHETLRNDLLGYLALLPGLYRLFGLPRYTPEILPLPAALARETRDLNERDRRILRTAFQHGAISTTITLPLSRIGKRSCKV